MPYLKLKTSLHLKMDGWKMYFHLEWPQVLTVSFLSRGGQPTSWKLNSSLFCAHDFTHRCPIPGMVPKICDINLRHIIHLYKYGI